jgi:transcriptional regulator with GAF, ATPase, and Fis domain
MVQQVVWHQQFGTMGGALDHSAFLRALGARGIGALPNAAASRVADLPRGAGIVFCDTLQPEVTDFVRRASHGGTARVLVVASSHAASAHGVWTLLRHGASDVLRAEARDVDRVVAEAAARLERWSEVDRVVGSSLVRDNLVGESPSWVAVLRQLVEAARYTDAPILLLGETGTGKELAARLVHSLDARPQKRSLVVVDCGAIAPELSGSELFGHERGAFTGALTARDGAFALADGGTLFLDEVGDLPLHLQPELLRVVQERAFKRLGSNAWQNTHFRLVSATHRDLDDGLASGRFRGDLYYRIASISLRLPALRDRPDDVLPLARHFMSQLRPLADPPELDPIVEEYLIRRPYPGNVRELRQLVTRIMHRHVGNGPITAGEIPEDERPAEAPLASWLDAPFEHAIRRAVSQGVPLREIGQAATEAAITIACDLEGSVQRAARRLHVTDRALQLRRKARSRPGRAESS